MVRKHDSSTRVLTFVLTVAFGLLSAVIAYASFKGGSFELRSKAATEEVILKQWTFDADKEGWDAKDFFSGVVSKGTYQLTVNPKEKISVPRELTPRLINTIVQTHLKYPANKFRIRLAVATSLRSVDRPTPTGKEIKKERILPSITQKQAFPFVMKVSQKYQGKSLSVTEQQISAVADGKEHEYSFEFSKDSSLKRVDELQIQFVSLPLIANTTVSVNDIALIGMKEIPVPTKIPPQKTETKNGYLRRFSTPNSDAFQYKLVVIEGGNGEKGGEYLLTQNVTNPCGSSKGAQLMCRYFSPQKLIDFEQYVDKYVTVTGVTSGTIKEQKVTLGQPVGYMGPPIKATFPTFMVFTIKLATTPLGTPTPILYITPTLYPSVSLYPTSSPIPTPVASSLEILSPNGGETLTIGTTYTIKWNSTHNFDTVDLQYASDSGFSSMIAKNIPDMDTFSWQVNSIYGTGNYKIYIYGTTNGYMTANDNSNNYFTIIN